MPQHIQHHSLEFEKEVVLEDREAAMLMALESKVAGTADCPERD